MAVWGQDPGWLCGGRTPDGHVGGQGPRRPYGGRTQDGCVTLSRCPASDPFSAAPADQVPTCQAVQWSQDRAPGKAVLGPDPTFARMRNTLLSQVCF